jgi:hypothetical protein
MAQVHKRATAKRDLIQHFVHLAENTGMETTERFLLQADATFADSEAAVQFDVREEATALFLFPGRARNACHRFRLRGSHLITSLLS